MGALSVTGTNLDTEIRVLIEDYRDRCLWFWRRDYMPETLDEVRDALDLTERYGDRSGFQRAEGIRKSLSRLSNQQS